MKVLSPEAKRARLTHDNFLTMLNAAVLWPEKWDASDIIGKYWSLAFNQEITEEDFNNDLFDRIRKQLLINAGVINPVLEENYITKNIKSQITF